MNPVIHINTTLIAGLTFVLIAVDYLRKLHTDIFQRRVLLALLSTACASVLIDFTGSALAGIPGPLIKSTMYCLFSILLVTQNCTFCLTAVFIDYFAYNNTARSIKYFRIAGVFLALYTLSVIANLPLGFYFSISEFNTHVPGKLYTLMLALNCLVVPVIIADICMASEYFRRTRGYFIILVIFVVVLGARLGIIFKISSLGWSCFSVAILYIYFFIIRSDSKLDNLTGIGNRYSFNEFIDKLSRKSSMENYSIVMIDLDHFKEINDNLGHIEGDNALRDMATIIRSCTRDSDFAARYGGDEFVLATRAENDIKRIMDRIQEAINTQNRKGIRPYQLYMSYGYDVYTTSSGQSITDFLAHIDSLMYKNKEERRKAGIASAITSKSNSSQG